jgi:hypothetical protein
VADNSAGRPGPNIGFPALTGALSDFHAIGAHSAARVAEMSRIAVEAAESRSAEGFVRRILASVKEFEATLDPAREVGIRLVSFGQSITFRVDHLACVEPSLVVFVGKTEDGQPVQLVQHLSQVSFLLMALPRLAPEKPRNVIGFEAQKR